jgi:hypothetical protein
MMMITVYIIILKTRSRERKSPIKLMHLFSGQISFSPSVSMVTTVGAKCRSECLIDICDVSRAAEKLAQ